ncbi:hypothetical protein ACFV4X_36285 [Streptomyces ardesiacus]|uniref:hypothetical protein n=1 Tax=Streptomyces ardesiacus TaxID=285564 RepID=UPI00366847C7
MKIGSWLHRQLTTWSALHPGQQHLMTALGLTSDTNPLAPARHKVTSTFVANRFAQAAAW